MCVHAFLLIFLLTSRLIADRLSVRHLILLCCQIAFVCYMYIRHAVRAVSHTVRQSTAYYYCCMLPPRENGSCLCVCQTEGDKERLRPKVKKAKVRGVD